MPVHENQKHIIAAADFAVLEKYKQFYVELAYRYLRDRDEAEELYQENIYKLLNKGDSAVVSSIVPFFTRTIKNACLDRLRARSRRAVHPGDIGSILEQTDIAHLSSSMDEDIADIDIRVLLANCRRRLPELTYEVFLAKRLDRLSYKEICKTYGISENVLHAEIKKAVKVFREEFKGYYFILFTTVMLGSGSVCDNFEPCQASEQLLPADGGDEVLQVERLEVCDVLEPFFLERSLDRP